MYRFALVLPAFLLVTASVLTPQQSSTNATGQKSGSYAAIPVEAAKQQNPVKPSPESAGRAKRWWTLDCEMCHGKNGDGKGETAKEMKLTMMDFSNPDTLKDTTTCPPKDPALKPKKPGTWSTTFARSPKRKTPTQKLSSVAPGATGASPVPRSEASGPRRSRSTKKNRARRNN